MATIQQKLQNALEIQGETVVGRTAHYIKMTRKAGGFYFLGTAGALRRGSKVTYTTSLTGTKFYNELLTPRASSHHLPEDVTL